ncbi:MAG TPA: hypothetical protein VFM80_03095 [Gracilimonas sp.]|uniref:hypothetical protein n=1 Tax=Gracilimonas sp. TaxID=1974203 RepID=UPI002DABA732|nr:hypothetical protein [Gracilimonas sp.]
MKKVNLLSVAKAILTFVLFAGILNACSNSTSSGEEEHEPVGFVIYEGNTELVSQNISGEVNGNLTVETNSSTTFRVAFIDVDGEVFTPDKAEHSLQFQTVDGSGSFSITQENANEPFLFAITGESGGNSSLTFQLLHVGAVEFESATVPVTITSSN